MERKAEIKREDIRLDSSVSLAPVEKINNINSVNIKSGHINL